MNTSRPTPDVGGPVVSRPPRPAAHVATLTRLTRAGDAADRVPVAAVDGALALDPSVPGRPAGTVGVAVVHEEAGSEDVHAWAARFAQAVVEVLGGDRPLPQLLRWTSERVYAQLGRRVRVLLQTAPASQRARMVRPQVRSVHVCQPRPGVAEVSVHVRHGRRSRALAARLERTDGRWQCTVLQLG